MWVRRVQAGRGAGAELLRGGEREREREERWPELGAMLRSGQREEEADLKQDRIVTIMTSAVGTTLKGRE